MPHQCTNCGHVFPDGSKEMLSGCPDCGGNKFQFKQGSVDDVAAEATEQQPTPDDPGAADDPAPSGSEPATESTGTPDSGSAPETADPAEAAGTTDPTDAEVLDDNRSPGGESPAQSSARSDIVSDDELPDSPPPADDSASTTDSQSLADQSATDAADAGEATADEATSSSLDQLRQELNDQFESIRIVSPGQYELNLMELYDRDEYIISLREDGRYVIEVPDSWDTDTPS